VRFIHPSTLRSSRTLFISFLYIMSSYARSTVYGWMYSDAMGTGVVGDWD
jgi:hypothetical protein